MMIIIIIAEFLQAILFLSLWLVKALRQHDTPALLCSERRRADSWPPHDITNFEFWSLQLFRWWWKQEYAEETTAAWSESCEKLLQIWLQISFIATGIRTHYHSSEFRMTNPLGHLVILSVTFDAVVTVFVSK